MPHYPPPHPVVGILGGMGPAATIDLMRRVMAATPAQDDLDHVHLLVDQNPKVPSRIAALVERTGPSPRDELVRMARNLEASGATMLAIACNTAHGYAGDIAAAVDIPLLDMIDLTAAAVGERALPSRRVGMLASTAVLRQGLYEKAFATSGIQTVYPQRQDDIMGLIRGVKEQGAEVTLRETFAGIARELSGGVDLLVVACTELSLLTDVLDADIAWLDAMDVLASAIVERGRGIQTSEAIEAGEENP